MKSVPKFLQGAWRAALRVALEEVCTGCQVGDITRQTRGWKLFFLLPRMLLHKKPRGGAIPRQKLEERFVQFVSGDGWIWWSRPNKQRSKRTRVQCDGGGGSPLTIWPSGPKEQFPLSRWAKSLDLGKRWREPRWLQGTLATLRDLTDPRKRPSVPREALSRTIQEFQPRARHHRVHRRYWGI